MPKHKQFLKSEKAKIKLKGAKLPKGLNVTKTDFKIKKIVIRDQLKDSFNEDGTVIRNQNVKELLTKLQHHNSTYRNEGLRYLKDILLNHPEETSKQFGNIIKGIAPMSLDIERDVRRECFKALNILLSTTSSETIAPFFDILVSYLKCAMTHIQFSIQEDSLHLMDSLLKYLPSLIATNGDEIFTSFLNMISKLRSESKTGRTLSLNLNSKITNVKWRTKVLDRLLGLLHVKIIAKRNEYVAVDEDGVQNAFGNEVKDAFTLESSSKEHQKVITSKIHYFDPEKPMYFPIIKSHLNKNCSLPSLSRKPITDASSKVHSLYSYDEEKRIQHYNETLVPLMFETWMEVRPNIDGDIESKSCLTNEAALTLKIVLQIFDKLYDLIMLWCLNENNENLLKWFTFTYNRDFCTQFLDAFPYVQNEGFRGSKKKSKGAPTEADVALAGGHNCYLQNLNAAYLFCCLNENLTNSTRKYAEKIINYLLNNLETIEKSSPELSTLLVSLLRVILLKNGATWLKSKLAIVTDLLMLTMNCYTKMKFSKEIRTRIQILFCDIVLNDKIVNVYGKDTFKIWLEGLPLLLCSSHISQHVLKTFSCLGKQQNKFFLKSFAENSEKFIENISKIEVTGAENSLEGRKIIVYLFFWLNDTNDLVNKLKNRNDDVSSEILQILALKNEYK